MRPSHRNSFPLFNRIVIFCLSGSIPVGILVALTKPNFRADLNVVTGLLLLVFFGMGCVGVWFSLFARTRSPEELEPLAASGAPKFSDGALVCRYSGLTGAANSVIMDFSAGLIHFQNCHTPRTFLAVAAPWFSCPLDDLLAAHRYRYRGETLTIVTRTGKAVIPDTADNYELLCQSLAAIIPPDRKSPDTEHPLMGMLYVGGAIAGLFLGWFLTPMAASNTALALYVTGGTVAGVVTAHCGILFFSKLLNVSIVQPLGLGIVGAGIGLYVSRMMGRQVGWNTLLLIIPIVAGAIGGIALGLFQQIKKGEGKKGARGNHRHG